MRHTRRVALVALFLLASTTVAWTPAWAVWATNLEPVVTGFVSSVGGRIFAVPSHIAVVGFDPPFLPFREDRGVFEFDLEKVASVIHPGGTILRAMLEFNAHAGCLPAAPFLVIHVFGYAADGAVTTEDFGGGALLATFDPMPMDPFEAVTGLVDVTDFVQTLTSRFAGFSLRMDPSTTPGCRQGEGRLLVEYVPDPAIRDAFLCYRAVPSRGTAAVFPPTTHLGDEFEDKSFDVETLDALCSPAAAAGEAIHDATTYLGGHGIRPASGEPSYVRRSDVRISDEFGKLALDLLRPRRLLLPMATSVVVPPAPPDPASHDVDSFTCYDVLQTPGQPKFTPVRSVTIHDGFTDPGQRLTLLRPVRLCAPTERSGAAIKHAPRHLVCYLVAGVAGQGVRRSIGQVFIADDFLGAAVNVVPVERELCVSAFPE